MSSKQTMSQLLPTSTPVEKLMIICISFTTTIRLFNGNNEEKYLLLVYYNQISSHLLLTSSFLHLRNQTRSCWWKEGNLHVLSARYSIFGDGEILLWNRMDTEWLSKANDYSSNGLTPKVAGEAKGMTKGINFEFKLNILMLTLAKSSLSELVMLSERRSKHIERQIAIKASSILPKLLNANARR